MRSRSHFLFLALFIWWGFIGLGTGPVGSNALASLSPVPRVAPEKIMRPAQKVEEVSVRLRPLKGNVSVSGQDLSILTYGEKATILRGFDSLIKEASPREPLQKWQIRFETLQGEPVWAVSDSATGKLLTKIKGRFLELRGENIRVDLRPAPDHLRVVATKKKTMFDLQLVGLVPLEDYIEGVISAEVPKGWPLEALKAQAVAARSFALAKIAERQRQDKIKKTQRDWLLESSVLDQVFDHTKRHDAAARAARETRGEVLQNASGRVALALYHADCGGQTDEAESVWGGSSYKTSSQERSNGTARDHCNLRRASQWHLELSLLDLTAFLRKTRKLSAHEQISQLRVIEKTPGGRAEKVALYSAASKDHIGLKSSHIISGEDLRQALGYNRLRSSLFQVVVKGNLVKFQGRGFGHGVGLCQWGSKELAQAGKSYQEILLHYYPNLKLRLGPLSEPLPDPPRRPDLLASQ